MKILVIGASGQLPHALSEAERPSGWRLWTMGRPDLDITQPDAVRECVAAHAPDVVVNAAAYTAVDKAEDDEVAAYAVNRDGAEYLARACAEQGAVLAHVSTDYVFDGAKDAPWIETDPPNPLGVYGASKLAGEEAVRAACARHVILRTAWVFSPWGHNFVRTMLRLASEREELRVVDDQHGCPTYAPHLADAILKIIARLSMQDKAAWGTYHLAGSGEATWHGLAAYIMDCSRQLGGPWAQVRPIPTADFPTRAQRPANSRLDCSLAEQTFGVRLPHWREGVKLCVERILKEGREA